MTNAHTKQNTQRHTDRHRDSSVCVCVCVRVRVSQSYWQKSKRRRRRLERHKMNSLLKGHVVRPRDTGHVANAKWCQLYARPMREHCLLPEVPLYCVYLFLMNSPAPLWDVRRLGTQLYRTHRWVVAAYASWAATNRRESHSRCRQWSDGLSVIGRSSIW